MLLKYWLKSDSGAKVCKINIADSDFSDGIKLGVLEIKSEITTHLLESDGISLKEYWFDQPNLCISSKPLFLDAIPSDSEILDYLRQMIEERQKAYADYARWNEKGFPPSEKTKSNNVIPVPDQSTG